MSVFIKPVPFEEPESFVFTPENKAKAEKFVAKYPQGRQASAVLALLDLAQRQHDGWVPQKAIEHIADFLDMPKIRVMEVASFFTMVNQRPVGKYLVQVCGTTPCWLRGSDDVFAAIKDAIGAERGDTTEDGLFTVVEVECLGACVNAPMVQINDDFYEDLDVDSVKEIFRALKAGETPKTGSRVGRQSSEPEGDRQTLTGSPESYFVAATGATAPKAAPPEPSRPEPVVTTATTTTTATATAKPETKTDGTAAPKIPATKDTETTGAATGAPADTVAATPSDSEKPAGLDGPRGGVADDLKRIKGIGPKIETTLNALGIYHFDQIARWTDAHEVWINNYLSFKGRIARERWIEQAGELAGNAGLNTKADD